MFNVKTLSYNSINIYYYNYVENDNKEKLA